jgi:hypothetical protein
MALLLSPQGVGPDLTRTDHYCPELKPRQPRVRKKAEVPVSSPTPVATGRRILHNDSSGAEPSSNLSKHTSATSLAKDKDRKQIGAQTMYQAKTLGFRIHCADRAAAHVKSAVRYPRLALIAPEGSRSYSARLEDGCGGFSCF